MDEYLKFLCFSLMRKIRCRYLNSYERFARCIFQDLPLDSDLLSVFILFVLCCKIRYKLSLMRAWIFSIFRSNLFLQRKVLSMFNARRFRLDLWVLTISKIYRLPLQEKTLEWRGTLKRAKVLIWLICLFAFTIQL